MHFTIVIGLSTTHSNYFLTEGSLSTFEVMLVGYVAIPGAVHLQVPQIFLIR